MTNLKFLVNYVDALITHAVTPADYIEVDLTNDYLIWTAGNTIVKDLMTTPPTSDQLNAAASIIPASTPLTVALCLLYDYSHDVGGVYYTHKIFKDDVTHLDNLRYTFCFNFDAATATEPQLEAWDDATHATFVKNVLGLGTANNSFVKGKRTTGALPGAGWAGSALAGGTNVLLLNDGAGTPLSIASDLYCNLKIVIPITATPAAETFVLTVRYTYL